MFLCLNSTHRIIVVVEKSGWIWFERLRSYVDLSSRM